MKTIAKMILNDWQRGKIPYFVPPPSHDSTEFDSAKKKENEEMAKTTRLEEEEKERLEQQQQQPQVPQTLQNYHKIRLTVNYSGDDDRPLEMFDENFDSDEEVLDEDEDLENENELKEKSSNDTSLIENNNATKTNISDNTLQDKNIIKETITTEDNEILEKSNIVIEENMECNKDDTQSNQSESDDDEIIDDDMSSSDEEVKTSVGSFEVTALRKLRRKSKAYKLMAPLLGPQLTSKERRAAERAQKRKKVGSNFYEVTNVKNKNRDKKKPINPSLACRGHEKKKSRK